MPLGDPLCTGSGCHPIDQKCPQCGKWLGICEVVADHYPETNDESDDLTLEDLLMLWISGWQVGAQLNPRIPPHLLKMLCESLAKEVHEWYRPFMPPPPGQNF